MNVLVIGRQLPNKRDSWGLFEFNQALALKTAGCEVVFGFADNRSLLTNHTRRTVDEWRQGMHCIGNILPSGKRLAPLFEKPRTRFLRDLLTQLVNESWIPDVVYAHFPLLTLTPSFVTLLKDLKIPLVCMEHWSRVKTADLEARQLRFLRQLVSYSGSYCCVSEDLCNSVRTLTGAVAEDVPVIPNMVDAVLFSRKDVTKKPSGSFTFVVIGRLDSAKRVDIVIKAFSQLHNSLDVELVLAGDGPLRRKLENQVRILGISDKVSFLGWIGSEKVAYELQSSDCCVSASSLETFCLPIVEAWMCGTPCIAPESNPLRKHFAPERGVLFEDDDVSSLANAMREVILRSREGRYDCAVTSEWAASQFSSETVALRIIEIFKKRMC